MRLVVIGQAAFGAAVLERLIEDGHEIAGVFTPPDSNGGKTDPAAAVAAGAGLTNYKFQRYQALKRDGGAVLPGPMEAIQKCNPELIVLAFVTEFIPRAIYDFPRHGSIVYHPSLLPLHRGASAINWTIMAGDKQAGFTIFYADEGLDTGDIVLQRGTDIGPNENLNAVYGRFLFPEGVNGMADAVKIIEDGTAPRIQQDHTGNMQPPYYDQKWQKPAQVDWSLPAQVVHDFIRGSDRQPGAFTVLEHYGNVTLYGSQLGEMPSSAPIGSVMVAETQQSMDIYPEGILFTCGDGNSLLITTLKIGSRRFDAGKLLDEIAMKAGL